MWTLASIKAQNIAAFREFSYTPAQGHTTLVFGNNMDNDSQGSNGSGKSALMEAISIAITGGTLRDISMDEIINDAEDTAVIEAHFYNSFSRETFVVTRTLSRKNPQQIVCRIYDGKAEADREETKQASVADFNRYILDKIGLTKDDVFNNFVLSKHRFKSFLSGSDRDKKEIINRFSNANIVDEAVEALLQDLAPEEERLRKSELEASRIEGSIAAIEEQITRVAEEESSSESNKKARKQELEDAIEQQKEHIRTANESNRELNNIIASLDGVYNSVTEIENVRSLSLAESYRKIAVLFDKNKITGFDNWEEKSKELSERLERKQQELLSVEEKSATALEDVNRAQDELKKITEAHAALESENSKASELLSSQLSKIKAKLQLSEKELSEIHVQQQQTNIDIKTLKNKIAGQISCPKCRHVFVLDPDIDVAVIKKKIASLEEDGADTLEKCTQKEQCISDLNADRKDVFDRQKKLVESLEAGLERVKTQAREVDRLHGVHRSVKEESDRLNGRLKNLEDELNRLFDEMFDSSYNIVDRLTKAKESSIQLNETRISACKGSIAAFQQSIKDLDAIKDGTLIAGLKEDLEAYKKQLEDTVKKKHALEAKVNGFKEQEIRFAKFKTHLANSKIEALSRITNEFLEQIGSDIRIRFSGFTVLKSGKIRDKISISLIRNGVDCGSFGKFSEGEKARVNLANILAMNKLTNVNCEDGKGLDLLVLDEILESTDESGLSSIFNALNTLQITALVVSHGNVAENYPHRLIVKKQNGISSLNED
jgi:exonuclease SbcC